MIMKRKMVDFRKMTAVLIGLMLTVSMMAQRGNGPGPLNTDKPGRGLYCQAIPDMTEEQQQKIAGLRTAQIKEMNLYRNDLSIKRAELEKLQTADNADLDKINEKIDEIGKIKTEMAKKRAAHIQKVRSVLTEEQRAVFDSRHGHRAQGMRMGRGRSMGPGRGFGHECPYGRF